MSLSPEERQRIYEEEKARHEAQLRLKREATDARWTPPRIAVGCLSLLGIVLILMFIGVVCSRSSRGPTETATKPIPDSAVPALDLLSSDAAQSQGGGYMEVTGMVRNSSSVAINSLIAVAELYDRNERFVAADDALIEYDPLLPGQSSPFKVMVRFNPKMKTYRIEFKRLGALIPHVDRRGLKAR